MALAKSGYVDAQHAPGFVCLRHGFLALTMLGTLSDVQRKLLARLRQQIDTP
jgi:hypothetical protein